MNALAGSDIDSTDLYVFLCNSRGLSCHMHVDRQAVARHHKPPSTLRKQLKTQHHCLCLDEAKYKYGELKSFNKRKDTSQHNLKEKKIEAKARNEKINAGELPYLFRLCIESCFDFGLCSILSYAKEFIKVRFLFLRTIE